MGVLVYIYIGICVYIHTGGKRASLADALEYIHIYHMYIHIYIYTTMNRYEYIYTPAEKKPVVFVQQNIHIDIYKESLACGCARIYTYMLYIYIYIYIYIYTYIHP